MKTVQVMILALVTPVLGFGMASCTKDKGPAEKMGEKVDDALDQRPAEKLRDKVEDVVE